MLYRSSTYRLDDRYLLQHLYDSEEKEFYIWIYTAGGKRIKACERSISERGALDNALTFLRDHEKELKNSNDGY